MRCDKDGLNPLSTRLMRPLPFRIRKAVSSGVRGGGWGWPVQYVGGRGTHGASCRRVRLGRGTHGIDNKGLEGVGGREPGASILKASSLSPIWSIQRAARQSSRRVSTSPSMDSILFSFAILKIAFFAMLRISSCDVSSATDPECICNVILLRSETIISITFSINICASFIC